MYYLSARLVLNHKRGVERDGISGTLVTGDGLLPEEIVLNTYFSKDYNLSDKF